MSKHIGNLYILPFSENDNFIKFFLGNINQLSKKQIKLIKSYKHIIFEAFLLIKEQTIFNKNCIFQVDEIYGRNIIKLAQHYKINIDLPVATTNKKTFSLIFGKEFNQHITTIDPLLVSAVVKYNPANKKINRAQLIKIKKLNLWCQDNNYHLALELLVPPTLANLKRVKNKREIYDSKIKPNLILKTIQEFHRAGIEPDIWEIEALETIEAWHEVIDLIRDDETREQVGVIMLASDYSFAKIKQLINIAPRHLLNGFAVGDIIYMRPLQDLHNRKINSQQAVKQIAKNYLELIRYWEKK